VIFANFGAILITYRSAPLFNQISDFRFIGRRL
jgi:hypothetical protein